MDNGQLTMDNEVRSGMRYRYRSEEEMKDSGVEWIGKIPEMWGLCKVKNIVKVKDGTHDTPKYVDKSTDARPLVTSKDVKNGKINLSEVKYISYNDYILINTRSDVKKYDVIMPMIGTVGNPTIVDIDDEFSIKNVALFKTCHNKNLSKFLTYIFQSIVMKEQLNLLTRGGVQNFASLSMLQNLKLVKIPNKYLNRIISFLDEKTAQFDSIISKKEALIQRLEEAKKSIISEVVTGKVKVVKTSNGYELVERKKEEMKDSGVEWLGNVPNKWKVVKLKHLVSTKITDGPHETPILVDEGIPFLSAEAIVNSKVSITNMRGYITEEQYDIYAKKSRVYIGDILFCKSGSTTGKSALVETNEKFGIWSPLAIIRANFEKIHSKNLFYIIQSSYFRVQVENYWTFGTQPNIGMGTLENLYIPFNEDKKEQKYICEYLDKKIEAVDGLINKVSSQINYLKQAKQSLISEAVTGKIEILD